MSLAFVAHYYGKEQDAGDAFDIEVRNPLFWLEPAPTQLSERARSLALELDVMDTVRILVEKGHCDPTIGSFEFPSALFTWSGPVEPFAWLYRQEVIPVDPRELWGWAKYTIYHIQAASTCPGSKKIWLKALWCPERARQIMSARSVWEETVLHSALKGLLFAYLRSESPDLADFSPHLLVIITLITNGADIHARTQDLWTPLGTILSTCPPFVGATLSLEEERQLIDNKRSAIIRRWLRAIVEAGFDIAEYVRKEEMLQPTVRVANRYRWYKERLFILRIWQGFQVHPEKGFVFSWLRTWERDDLSDMERSLVERVEDTHDEKIPGSWV